MGAHLYRIEDDTLFVKTQGNATLESTILYTDLCRKLITQHGYVLCVVDLRNSGMAPPEARRYQAQAIREFPAGSYEIATYGMNQLVSTFLQLTMRAASILTGRAESVMVIRDEAAALQWRDKRRIVMQTRHGKNRSSG
jgi:hypothetical protein